MCPEVTPLHHSSSLWWSLQCLNRLSGRIRGCIKKPIQPFISMGVVRGKLRNGGCGGWHKKTQRCVNKRNTVHFWKNLNRHHAAVLNPAIAQSCNHSREALTPGGIICHLFAVVNRDSWTLALWSPLLRWEKIQTTSLAYWHPPDE